MKKKLIYIVIATLAVLGLLIYLFFSGLSKNEDINYSENVGNIFGGDITAQLDNVTSAVLSPRASLLSEQDSIDIADEILYKKEEYIIRNSVNKISKLEIGDIIIYPYTDEYRGYILQKISEKGRKSYFKEVDLTEAFSSLKIKSVSFTNLTSEDIKFEHAKYLDVKSVYRGYKKMYSVSYEFDSLGLLSKNELKEPHSRCLANVSLIWDNENGVDKDGNTIYEGLIGFSVEGDVSYIIPQNMRPTIEYKGRVNYSAENIIFVSEYNSESGSDHFVNNWTMITYDEVVDFNVSTIEGNINEVNEKIIETMTKELSLPIIQLKISFVDKLGLEIPFEVSVGYYQGEDSHLELSGKLGYEATGKASFATHAYTEHNKDSREYQEIQKVKETLSWMDKASETAIKGNQDSYFNYELNENYLYGNCRIGFDNIYVGPKVLIGMGLVDKEPFFKSSLVAGLNLTMNVEGELLLNLMDPLEQSISSNTSPSEKTEDGVDGGIESTFAILAKSNLDLNMLRLSHVEEFEYTSSYGLKLSKFAETPLSYDLLDLMAVGKVDKSEYIHISDNTYKHKYAPLKIQLSQDGRIEKLIASMYATNYDIGSALNGNETLNNMLMGINELYPVVDKSSDIYKFLVENSSKNYYHSIEKSGVNNIYSIKHFRYMDNLYDIILVSQESTGRLKEVTIVNSNLQVDLSDADFRVSVSSTLKEFADGIIYFHTPQNMFDNNRATAWVEASEDSGVGEWIYISSNEQIYLESISINNGYSHSDHFYRENNRLMEVKITSDKGDEAIYTLEDYNMGLQKLTVEFGLVKWIKLEVLGVSKGTTFNDLAIADIILNDQFIKPTIKEMNLVDFSDNPRY